MRGNMVSTLEQGTGGMVIPVCLDSFWFCFSYWQFFKSAWTKPNNSNQSSHQLSLAGLCSFTPSNFTRLWLWSGLATKMKHLCVSAVKQLLAVGVNCPARQQRSINSFSLSFCVANLFPSGTIWLRKICWTKSRLEFQDVHSCGPHVKPAKYKPIACYGFPCEGNIGARLGCTDLPEWPFSDINRLWTFLPVDLLSVHLCFRVCIDPYIILCIGPFIHMCLVSIHLSAWLSFDWYIQRSIFFNLSIFSLCLNLPSPSNRSGLSIWFIQSIKLF